MLHLVRRGAVHPRNGDRDLAAYVSQGRWDAARCRARVKLFVAADVVAERLPPSIGTIEPIDGHSCFFDTAAATYGSLAMHLSLAGVDFKVIEPAELVEEIRRLAERYRRAAG